MRDKDGDTPLIIAVRNKNKDIAETLLVKGANVNIQDTKGNTALIIAGRNKDKDIARMLLAKGAGLNV